MKKSEMIELLHDYLSSLGISNSDETIAEHILHIVESNGMLPPRTKLDLLDAYDNAWDRE